MKKILSIFTLASIFILATALTSNAQFNTVDMNKGSKGFNLSLKVRGFQGIATVFLEAQMTHKGNMPLTISVYKKEGESGTLQLIGSTPYSGGTVPVGFENVYPGQKITFIAVVTVGNGEGQPVFDGDSETIDLSWGN